MRKHLNFKKLYKVLKERGWSQAWFYRVNDQLQLLEYYGLETMPLIEYMPICIRYESQELVAVIYNNNYNVRDPRNKYKFAYVFPSWRYHQIVEYIEAHKEELFEEEPMKYFESTFNKERACI